MLRRLFHRSQQGISEPTPTPFGQDSDPEFVAALAQLRGVETHVRRSYIWYRNQANRSMYEFYISGLFLISMSVSIPFVSTQDFAAKDTVISVMSLGIALLTALIGFNRWDVSWAEHRQTQLALDHLLYRWRVRIIEAKHQETAREAIADAVKATDSLLSEARSLETAVAKKIFEAFKPPQV
jgi:Protein of unknown function (DUF4231)